MTQRRPLRRPLARLGTVVFGTSCAMVLVLFALAVLPSRPVSGRASAHGFAPRESAEQARSRGKKDQKRRGTINVTVSRTEFRAGEPTVGVTNSGTVFFVAMEHNLHVDVLRSTDAGRSWKVVSPTFASKYNRHLISYDPYLYVDSSTGRVFTVDLTIACSLLSFSDDNGQSWTTNPIACGRPINDHQTVFSGPPAHSKTIGFPEVVYYCWNDVVTSSCSKSIDGGVTFEATGSPAFLGVDPTGREDRFCRGFHGHGVVGRDGTVYLPRELCGTPYLSISRDEGATWDRIPIPGATAVFLGSDPTVAVDDAGNIYFAWIDAHTLRPFLSMSGDAGHSWSKAFPIAPPRIAEANLLTVDIGERGLVFAYMGTENSSHPKAWHGYVTVIPEPLRRPSLAETVRVNPRGDPLKRGECGPGRCGDEILDFIDVVVADDGRSAWAAFVDACNRKCARTGFEEGNEGLAVHVQSRFVL